MRSHVVRAVATGLALLALFGFWLFLAPTQLGGSSTYSTTSGISMQPMMHKGDLAVVRSQAHYRVGEVVLYQSPTLHRPVLHRIIVIQNGRYYFKGDNNNFVDPGFATRDELVGALWVHVPVAGRVVAWIGKPAHAALLSGIAVALLFLGGATATRRRRRRRVPVAAPAVEPVVRAPSPVAVQPAPADAAAERSHWWYLWSGAAIVPVALTVLVGLCVLAVGYSTPTSRPVARTGAYSETGTFFYSGKAVKPSPIYPSGVVKTGQPIFTTIVHSGTFGFTYRFRSQLPHHVSGTLAMTAEILQSSSSWKSLYTLAKPINFTGDTATNDAVVDLRGLYQLVDQLNKTSGSVGADYSVALRVIVKVNGTVGAKPLHETFAPTLPFSVTSAMVKLDVAATPMPTGATYAPPDSASAVHVALNPVQSGSVPGTGPNHLMVARYRLPVTSVRMLGFLILGLAFLIAGFHYLDVRRKGGLTKEELLAAHLRSHVVHVASLNPTHATSTLEVVDFATLGRLARFLERPILLEQSAEARTYAVDDGAERYVYRAPGVQPAPSAKPVHASVPSLAHAPGGRRRRRTALRAGGLVAILVVAVTLITSFTATTTVPSTRAGATSQARQISQLTPAGCSSLALTSLVVKSGTASNNTSNALIVGSVNKDTLTDTGHFNCIVGGAGKDVVTANSTDICIIGPTGGTNYKQCTTAN